MAVISLETHTRELHESQALLHEPALPSRLTHALFSALSECRAPPHPMHVDRAASSGSIVGHNRDSPCPPSFCRHREGPEVTHTAVRPEKCHRYAVGKVEVTRRHTLPLRGPQALPSKSLFSRTQTCTADALKLSIYQEFRLPSFSQGQQTPSRAGLGLTAGLSSWLFS